MARYFDHNATTPLDDRVLEAMLPYMRESFGNPSSLHSFGRLARTALDQAREQVAALVGAHPSQILFTSGGTEANNTALKGIAGLHHGGTLLVSAVEHASLLAPATALTRHGWTQERLAVDGDGRVTPQMLQAHLTPETRLVSVMAANNETGVLQDIPALAAVAAEHGVPLHTDAVQLAGKGVVNFAASGAALMSLSAHKLYGPKGVGALVVERRIELEPLLHGGGQEQGRRGGTENLAGIVGFGRAAELAALELETRRTHLWDLRQRFEAQLAQQLPQAVVFGAAAERLPNTVFMALPGIDGQTLLMGLDQQGFALASGSACGSAENEPSHVLQAMGVAPELARGAIRVSFGKANDQQDVDALIGALVQQAGRLTAMAATAWI